MPSIASNPSNKAQMIAQNRIGQIGKTIRVFCTVARITIVLFLVVTLAGIGAVYVGSDFGVRISDLAGTSTFVKIVDSTIDAGTISDRDLRMINLFALALSQLMLLAFISVFNILVRDITENEKPFRVATARQLRRNTFWLVPLIFWNVLGAAFILLIALLLSYLIEYGAYLQEKADETTRVQEQVIVSLAEITENKSGQTGQHVRRVAEYTRILAEELGYPQEQLDDIRLASTMHDIGKLLVPSEILEKPGRLTDEEFAIIKQHTTDGGRLLENVDGDVMRLSRTIALDHHERWDGNGYAQGKAGEDISFEGRIVAVADVYDALTSRRSYKDAWDNRAAYDEIVRCSGTQFDPQVVEAFKSRYDDIDAVRQRLADSSA